MGTKWVDVYLPVLVQVEVEETDDGDKPTGNVGLIYVDYDGAPWMGTGSEDDVYDGEGEKWLSHADTEEIAYLASWGLDQRLTRGEEAIKALQVAEG